MPLSRTVATVCLILGAVVASAMAHDVPNRFFDRSVQLAVEAGRVHVQYELSISELTLAEQLLALVGPAGLAELPAHAWLERFAREMGELLAEGVEVRFDDQPVSLKVLGYSFDTFEGHPRFRFRFAGELPNTKLEEPHWLEVEDTNFFLERGAVRMALCPLEGTELLESTVPWTVDEVRVQPGWEMSPEEADEARRVRAQVRFLAKIASVRRQPAPHTGLSAPAPQPSPQRRSGGRRLRELLSPQSPLAMMTALAAAFLLGAAHALTPGHGKTVAGAYLVAQRGSLTHAMALSGTVVVTHTSSVFAVAAVLAIVDPALDRLLGRVLAMGSGLLVLGVGCVLLVARLRSRQAGGRGGPGRTSWLGVLGLGAAAGMVPCWDGVALVLWAVAVDRAAWGLVLLTAFTLGLGAVLAAIAVLAVKVPALFVQQAERADRVGRYISIAAALVIIVVGCGLTWNAWRS